MMRMASCSFDMSGMVQSACDVVMKKICQFGGGAVLSCF